ncbi:MAG: response regulator [Chloroflexi bacterium]|nr:response regulator [Chloroflexota bacterium]
MQFWGTRGSLPKPGPTTLRYGGNTSCTAVRLDDGTLLVFDCGTGAHNLGLDLLRQRTQPVHGHLFISHFHWDHIQGFPFFAPLFVPGDQWDVYAPGGRGQEVAPSLAGQMQYTYFPVALDQLGATIRYHDLGEGTFQLGAAKIATQYLNHPALALAYRVEVNGVTLVYATDHEPHASSPAGEQPTPGHAAIHAEDRRHIEFLAGADLVIHDSQYTDAEYPAKRGWGHTTIEWSVDYALAAGVKRLALYHHEPTRDDAGIDRVLEQAKARAGAALEVVAAAEGQTLTLAERPATVVQARAEDAEAPPSPPETDRLPTVLIVDDDPAIRTLLVTILRREGLRLLEAADGEAALQMARTERPELLLLDWQMPKRDGLSVCRALRADPDPYFQRVPIVLVTALAGPEHTEAGFDAGVNDYLTKPFAPPQVRTRVRSWLMRAATP